MFIRKKPKKAAEICYYQAAFGKSFQDHEWLSVSIFKKIAADSGERMTVNIYRISK
jgi:hypothetical protein